MLGVKDDENIIQLRNVQGPAHTLLLCLNLAELNIIQVKIPTRLYHLNLIALFFFGSFTALPPKIKCTKKKRRTKLFFSFSMNRFSFYSQVYFACIANFFISRALSNTLSVTATPPSIRPSSATLCSSSKRANRVTVDASITFFSI